MRDLYSKRFPELESLVHTPLEYCRSVKVRAALISHDITHHVTLVGLTGMLEEVLLVPL